MDENSEKWNSEWNLFSSCQKKKKKKPKLRNQKSKKISSNTVLKEHMILCGSNRQEVQSI